MISVCSSTSGPDDSATLPGKSGICSAQAGAGPGQAARPFPGMSRRTVIPRCGPVTWLREAVQYAA